MRSIFRSALLALVATLALTALTAAPALASGKPFVETKPATNIVATNASLNGVVNPNGAATKYYFEYGKTISYGQKTTEVSAGSGNTTLEESQELYELTPSTTYHFRIVATNTNGTTHGSDEVFSTPAGKPGLPELSVTVTKGSKYPVSYTESGVRFNFETKGGSFVVCEETTMEGEFINSKEVANAVVASSQCSGNPIRFFKSELLKGTLGYINKATKEVGLRLEPAKGTIWAPTFVFLGAKLRGELIGNITPVNSKASKLKLVYKQQSGNQEPWKLEGGTQEHEQLTWQPGRYPEPIGVNAAPVLSFTGAEVEIKA